MATTKPRRSGLASMLPDIKDALASVPEAKTAPAPLPEPAPLEESSLPIATPKGTPKKTDVKPGPSFENFERKEARLRQKQLDDLEALRKRINRTKASTGGERITDNTLIRIAVDMLLASASNIQGSTENELRKSVNL